MCPSEPLSIAWVARLPDCAMESLRRFQTMIWTAKHAVDICGCALTPMMDDVIIIAQITNNSEERKEWTNRQKGERSATLTSSMLSNDMSQMQTRMSLNAASGVKELLHLNAKYDLILGIIGIYEGDSPTLGELCAFSPRNTPKPWEPYANGGTKGAGPKRAFAVGLALLQIPHAHTVCTRDQITMIKKM